MMTKTILYSSLLCLYGMLVMVGSAQEADKKGLVCTALALEPLKEKELYYRDGKKLLPFTYKKAKRGPELALSVPTSKFELYRKGEEGVDGRPSYEMVGSCDLPGGTKSVFLLVTNAREGAERSILIKAYDDSLTGFPPGSMRFANFSQQNLKVEINGKESPIRRGALTVVKVRAPQDGGYVPVTFYNSAMEEVHFTKMYSQSRARKLVFITSTTNARRPFKFSFITENLSLAD